MASVHAQPAHPQRARKPAAGVVGRPVWLRGGTPQIHGGRLGCASQAAGGRALCCLGEELLRALSAPTTLPTVLQGDLPAEWAPDDAFPLLEELYLQENKVRWPAVPTPPCTAASRWQVAAACAVEARQALLLRCCHRFAAVACCVHPRSQHATLHNPHCVACLQLKGNLPTGDIAIKFRRLRIVDLSCECCRCCCGCRRRLCRPHLLLLLPLLGCFWVACECCSRERECRLTLPAHAALGQLPMWAWPHRLLTPANDVLTSARLPPPPPPPPPPAPPSPTDNNFAGTLAPSWGLPDAAPELELL